MNPDRKLILHDFFIHMDGGERVAVILAKQFRADLVTGHLEKSAFFDRNFEGVRLQNLDAYRSAPGWLRFSKILQLWWTFSHFPPASTPWTIFSGSISPLAYHRISGRKILYCLTPPRLLYDQKRFLVQQVPFWQRPFLRFIMMGYRRAYEKAVCHMDRIITISNTVMERTKGYLGRDSLVVYPPCETGRFRWIEDGNFFLSTARVDPLKRVALIVKSFLNMPDRRLVVVSGGSDLPKIYRMAGGALNIEILGWVDDEKLIDLMGRCIATIYIPRDEDFGISPVESMAAGKPVIGVQEGALLETVGGRVGYRAGEGNRLDCTEQGFMVTDCGVLIPKDPTVEDVVKAVEWMTIEKARKMRGACEARARRFDARVFLETMQDVLEEVKQGSYV